MRRRSLERLDRFLLDDGDGGLAFRHALLREAAYHGLSFRQRRLLHRRVGEALELGAVGGHPAASPAI